MEISSISPEFNNKYIVFAHGSRLISKKESSFKLGPNYRIVTLHKPGIKIKENLTRIILEQINSKIDLINNLFYIGCPIARRAIRENLENCFITDWLLQRHPDPISIANLLDDLENIGDTNEDISKITTNFELKEYINTLDITEIKNNLGFEIRTYRPNEDAPKLLLEFKFNKALTNVKSGIFNPNDFKNFDFDETDKFSSISLDIEPSLIKSIVEFNNNYSYVFDPTDIVCPTDKSFFDTINPKIKSGLIVVLSCGTYDGKITRELRDKSLNRQNNTCYKKYMINYNIL